MADDTDRLKVPGGWLYRVIGGGQALWPCASSPTKKKDGSGGLPNSRRPWTGCAAVEVSERPPPTAHLCDVERAPTTPTWLASLEPPMPGPCSMVCTRRGGAVRGEAPRPQLHQHRSHAGARSFKRAGRCKSQVCPIFRFSRCDRADRPK